MKQMPGILCLTLCLCACGFNYQKTASGTIDNQSTYVLAVTVDEGCYDGKQHNFKVNPSVSRDFKYDYICNDHDDESDSLTIQYLDFTPSSYDYFELDFLPYSRGTLKSGSTILYYEDELAASYTLNDSDIDNQNGVGRRFHNDGNVALTQQTLRIKPTSADAAQVFIGIASEDFSPVLPPITGSFERDSMIFQPMARQTLKTSGSYHSNGKLVTCDNFECEGRK